MKKFLALLFGVCVCSNLPTVALQYQLLSDSTITPHNGAVATGPSEPLTGSFWWVPHAPSDIEDCLAFDITNLNFSSRLYTLTLASGSQPDNVTSNGPAGQTALNANVNWTGAALNPYMIGGFGEGTFSGPAAAPAELLLTEGFGPGMGGNWIAYLYLHAKLVTPPSPVTVTTLASFDGTNGSVSEAALLLGPDRSYYGTTISGGSSDSGTIFKVTATGRITSLASFNGPTGGNPQAGLILGRDGNYYGTTLYGGLKGAGTVFKLTPEGRLSTLVSFNYDNGANPYAGLIQGGDGNFYGTTFNGGQSDAGTVFKLTPNGKLTTLVSFDGRDGSNPQAALVQGADGNFYGTTVSGGADFTAEPSTGWGTVFKMKPDGSLTTLASFNGMDGAAPLSPLTPAANGQFYGTTYGGGVGFTGTNYTGLGTIFSIGENGGLATLHYFTGYPDEGAKPEFNKLVMDPNGNLYGTTHGGGQNGSGSIFQFSRSGKLTTLYSFPVDAGNSPSAGLTASGAAMTYYGTTMFGGEFGHGTIFKVTIFGGLPGD